jgi:predicted DNA-binding transcriptional regulator YafY
VSAVSPIRTPFALLAAAIAERHPLRLRYHGRERLVSPHALGFKNGRAMLLALQHEVDGGTQPAGWRNFIVDDVERISPADAGARWRSADGYDPAHPFNAIDEVLLAVR